MKNRSLVSINDFTKAEQIQILNRAAEFEKNPSQRILQGKVVASLFFEPSTRTRLSFESAVNRLSGRIIGFSDASSSSTSKGESLKDTILTVSNYSDLIVMRHPIEGSARWASEVATVPIINAGDGANQHPTQCLLDMYTIRQTQGSLDNLNIAFVGDLKYGRTVHSLVMALSQFNTTFHLISPSELKLPSSVKMYIKEANLNYYQYLDIAEALPKVDILYMTRIQRERFSDPMEYERVKNSYILNNSMLADSRDNLKILHPLPRVNEINEDVDPNPKAYYFQQALNGVYVRQALIASILGL
ncbi:MAG: aspartate carbamoyltransferase [Bacteroidetes bacterium GWE2_42_24]|nr:MAG: aspartate carbamoyltransferase [Bacteroidetes bacterium GWE2_42_24]OFY25426.1 MAG: aspartate carbamoyltransferase [Bacteroidetes bacterium GWF2_43_11]PKP22309.1 MAG: aspartate carbamoyltransferase [Bacteroidetes bacterium HGW-Bacteroidetes-22]